jgi:hypothetical protein
MRTVIGFVVTVFSRVASRELALAEDTLGGPAESMREPSAFSSYLRSTDEYHSYL